jgi:hypothetical protein
MGISSIGSTPSFWQQDQNYWQQAEENDNATAASDSVINAISTAETNLGKGLASIANASALNRVNTQITALVEQALQVSGSSSSPASGGPSNASSTSSSSATGTSTASPSPATGTGTVVLTTSTSLATLGILPGGTITIGTGANTTTYTSSGTDTVADLIDAINVDLPTNANVTASINAKGQLVITSRDDKSSIFIGGSGTDAAAIGFGVGNNTFLPKAASTSSAASATSSTTLGSSTSDSTGGSSSSSENAASNAAKHTQSYTTVSSEIASDAASLLSDSGVGGNLVDMLA